MKKIAVSLMFLIAFITTLPADDEKKASDYPSTPVTDHHKVLQRGVGEWRLEQKMWSDTSEEPQIAVGTAICKSVLDGRAVAVHVETKSEAGTFKGIGIFTWNTQEKKYECSWVDIYSYYGIDSMEGTYDSESGTMTWTSTMKDPSSGAEIPVSMVETCPSADVMVSEFFIHIGENKVKSMVNTYTRVKKEAAKVSEEQASTAEKAPEKK